MTNGLAHHYQLGKSTLIVRGFRYDFKILNRDFVLALEIIHDHKNIYFSKNKILIMNICPREVLCVILS